MPLPIPKNTRAPERPARVSKPRRQNFGLHPPEMPPIRFISRHEFRASDSARELYGMLQQLNLPVTAVHIINISQDMYSMRVFLEAYVDHLNLYINDNDVYPYQVVRNMRVQTEYSQMSIFGFELNLAIDDDGQLP